MPGDRRVRRARWFAFGQRSQRACRRCGAGGGAPVVALQVAREILARHPNDAAALVREGDALFAMEHGQEAANSYQRALALEPRNNWARLGLGRIRLRTDPAGAEAIFLELLAA